MLSLKITPATATKCASMCNHCRVRHAMTNKDLEKEACLRCNEPKNIGTCDKMYVSKNNEKRICRGPFKRVNQ